ncbi:hypothetical protein [Marinobacter sp.]|uniref:hypothetical protein n=1 Tax=Marinobacter sp. TaxID=50741 RepID=UPI0025C4F126|nr:hypothetical protein [Marinobacter sp.]|tara:strand:- start:433 stop:591 length:159 start_codon:yes stop_codon:yes gene_type:complete
MARTLDQFLEQEKPEVVAEAKRKALEILATLDQQSTKEREREDNSVNAPPQK